MCDGNAATGISEVATVLQSWIQKHFILFRYVDSSGIKVLTLSHSFKKFSILSSEDQLR